MTLFFRRIVTYNKNMNKFFISLICALCAFSAASASAQKFPQVSKTARSAQKATEAARKAAMSAQESIPAAAAFAVPPAPAVRVPTKREKWVDNHQLKLIKVQKMVGISTRQAVENVRSWGAEYHPKNPRPTLREDAAFTAPDLTGFAVSPADVQAAPGFPFQNQRALIYRGLALKTDGAAIRNILENGLLLKDVGAESNTLILAMAGPQARSASVRAPVTNLTDTSSEAAVWASKRMGKRDVSVIVVVKSNAKGSYITINQDIAPEDIYAVTALLNVDGRPTWCKLETQGNNFRITPYNPAPEAK